MTFKTETIDNDEKHVVNNDNSIASIRPKHYQGTFKIVSNDQRCMKLMTMVMTLLHEKYSLQSQCIFIIILTQMKKRTYEM